MGLGRKPDPREQYKSLRNPGFCPPPRNCGCCCSGLHSTSRRQKAEGRKLLELRFQVIKFSLISKAGPEVPIPAFCPTALSVGDVDEPALNSHSVAFQSGSRHCDRRPPWHVGSSSCWTRRLRLPVLCAWQFLLSRPHFRLVAGNR
jgi:hypothetical protein